MDWSLLLAGFINSVLVTGAVQMIKWYWPEIREKYPVILPIITPMIGPMIGVGQNALTEALGFQVDLSPIMSAFTGAAAVMLNQSVKQIHKGN